MKKQSRFTLIELMVVIVIIGILVAIAVSFFKGGVFNYTDDAENAMKEHVQKLYPEVTPRVSCTGQDTDGDGYVSCQALFDDLKTGSEKTVLAECAVGWLNFNTGCKIPKGRLIMTPES